METIGGLPISEKGMSLMRKYIYELCIVVLGLAVMFLFRAQAQLEKDMRAMLIDIVTKNNIVMQQVDNTLREVQIALKEKK